MSTCKSFIHFKMQLLPEEIEKIIETCESCPDLRKKHVLCASGEKKTLMSQCIDSSQIYYSFVGFLKLCNGFVHVIIASSVIFTLLRTFTLENLYAVFYFATKLIEFLLCW